MLILVGTHEPTAGRGLRTQLESEGHRVLAVAAPDGQWLPAALRVLALTPSPDLALVDALAPTFAGADFAAVARRSAAGLWVVLRITDPTPASALADADDFILTGAPPAELAARVRLAERHSAERAARHHEASPAAPAARRADDEPPVPVCQTCRRVRDPAGRWEALESFVSARVGLRFTHVLCPICAKPG